MPIKTGTRQLAKPKHLGLQSTAKVDPKSKGAPRTMRCRAGCGGQAVEHPDGKGGTLLRCKNCNKCYAFSKM